MRLHRSIARLILAAGALAMPGAGAGAQSAYQTAQMVPFSDQQLDNLVAPIALYPDAILAQVLVAATFPDQVEFAVRYVRANGTRGIDDQPWDVSVKAVAHYQPVLNMLAERLDWTTTLGQAYATQSADVMDAVQRLRAMAHAQGNLVSTPEQDVVIERDRIVIVPAQPRVIYVPTYDPWAVYYRPVFVATGYRGFWSFGIGFPIGAWLSYDCDWWGRRVYYDGWRGGGWRSYARPYIHVTNVYVHPRYEVVYVNRTVVHRTVNYVNLTRYNTVHRESDFRDRGRGPGSYAGRGGRGNDRDDNRYGRGGNDRDDNRGVGRGSESGRNDGGRNDNGRGPGRTDDRRDGQMDRSAVQTPPRGVITGGSPVVGQRARPNGQQTPVATQRPQASVPGTITRPSAAPPTTRGNAPTQRAEPPRPVQRQAAPPQQASSPQRQVAPPQRQVAPPQRQAAPPQRQAAPPQSARSIPSGGSTPPRATPPAKGKKQ